MIRYSRGKKIFRKFADDDGDLAQNQTASDEELDAELDATVSPRLRGPLTRSSIKPRLLFPSTKQTVKDSLINADDDEEAVTDVEDHSNGNATPMGQTDQTVITPKAPRFAPVSPPTTGRATRSSKKADRGVSPTPPSPSMASDDEVYSRMHATRGRAGNISPFDSWQRTKRSSSGPSKKREGEAITRSGGDISKRLRG